jgi:hypothetical protein
MLSTFQGLIQNYWVIHQPRSVALLPESGIQAFYHFGRLLAMSNPQSLQNESAVPTVKGSSASSEAQTSPTQGILEDIQRARLSTSLRELGTNGALVTAFGEDPASYASGLTKQFAELSAKQRAPDAIPAKNQPSRLAATLEGLAAFFGPWNTVVAPNATVGLAQTPTSTNTSGSIGGEIYTGDIALEGQISNADALEQWWVNTWQYIIPLPISSSSNPGSLAYRFNVGASVGLYRQDFLTGSVHIYATVATTNDLAGQPIDFSQPVSSTFAIAADLPTSAVPPIVDGNAKITGSITLAAGKTPAIGIIIGVIVSVAKGNLQILPGENSFVWLTNPDATTNGDIGKIEYRHDPFYWVEAVTQRLAFQP